MKTRHIEHHGPRRIQRRKAIAVGMVAVAAIALFFAPSAAAQHNDYLIAQSAGGKLVTGAADLSVGELTIPARLFDRYLDENNFGSDPGFNAVSQDNVPEDYLALPASTPLAFDWLAIPVRGVVSNLFYWDGDGPVDFQAAVGTNLTATFSAFSATVNGAASDVAGFNIQTTNSTGGMHRHLNFTLTSGLGAPPEGVYLVGMQARMTGLSDSIPFYTLFATDSVGSGTYQTAVNWATIHLLIPGDVNNDGIVDIADVLTVGSQWQQPGPLGDANYDRIVDIADILVIGANWQSTTPVGGGAGFPGDGVDAQFAAPVPEPAGALLALFGIGALLVRRVVCYLPSISVTKPPG